MKTQQRRRRRSAFGWIVLVGAVVAAFLVVRGVMQESGEDELPPNAFYEVKRGDLLISVVEEGALRAMNETVVRSNLEGLTRIISLAPEGSHVKKGDLLVELDSSALKDKLNEQELAYQDNLFWLLQAKENLKIQKSLVESRIKDAELQVELAQSDLEKYRDGDAPQQIRTARARIGVLEEQVRIASERFARTQVLFTNGNSTKSELEADSLSLKREELGLGQYQEDLRLLQKFDQPNNLRILESNFQQAKDELERLKQRSANEIAQAEADLETSQKALDVMDKTLQRQRKQLANAKILAPQDGLVVYASSSPFQGRGEGGRDEGRSRMRGGAGGGMSDSGAGFRGGGGERRDRSRGGGFGGSSSSGGQYDSTGSAGTSGSTRASSASSSGGSAASLGSSSQIPSSGSGGLASTSSSGSGGVGSSSMPGGQTAPLGGGSQSFSSGDGRQGSGGGGFSSASGGQSSGAAGASFTSYSSIRQSSSPSLSSSGGQSSGSSSSGLGSSGSASSLSSSGSSSSFGSGGQSSYYGSGSSQTGSRFGSQSSSFFDPGSFMFIGSSGFVEEGAMVRQRQELIRLPDVSRMLAEVKIHESRVRQIRPGMSAYVRVETLPGRHFKGMVRRVAILPDAQSSWMNAETKVYATDVLIDDELPELKPGVSARAEIVITNLAKVLSVPIQAVTTFKGDHVCFVKRGSAVAPVTVTTGWFNDRFIEVISGLKEGDRVLLAPVGDQEHLDPESAEGGTNEVASSQSDASAPRSGAPSSAENGTAGSNATRPESSQGLPSRRNPGFQRGEDQPGNNQGPPEGARARQRRGQADPEP